MRARAWVLLTFSVLPSIGNARAADVDDWILIRLSAPYATIGGAEFQINVQAARTTGPGVLGFGQGSSADGGTDFEFDHLGGGTTKLTTTNGAGAVEIDSDLTGRGPDEFSFNYTTGWSSIDRGESVAFLFFTTGFGIESFDLRMPDDPDVVVDITTGGGSIALVAAGPHDAGAAASAGPVVVGSFTRTETIAKGIAGGFPDLDFCIYCAETWSAPDGATGASESPHPTWPHHNSFAGPRGAWSWGWTGAAEAHFYVGPRSVPVYAAFAPIGDAWNLFR